MVNHWISFDGIADKACCDYLVVLNAYALINAGSEVGVAVPTESPPVGDGNAHPFPHGNPPCPPDAGAALFGIGGVPLFCHDEKAFDAFLCNATPLITFYWSCQGFLPLRFNLFGAGTVRELS